MSSPRVSRGIYGIILDIYGDKEFPWAAASWYVDLDIWATLLQIICFLPTQVTSFSPTSCGIHRKFYCNSSQGDLGLQQKSPFSLITVALQYKKEKHECLTDQTVGASATLQADIPCGNISTSSPSPSIKFRLTIFQWRQEGCTVCYLSPGKLMWDFCHLILPV